MTKLLKKINYLSLFLSYIFILILINSCKKDPCDGKTCLNGGVCVDGGCQCPPGTSGSNCEIKDPCYNIKCLNGGSCANGACNCATGYSGSDCSKQVTPTKIRITKIDVTKFPATTPNGGGWDISDAPDLLPVFLKGTTILWTSPEYYQNAKQGTVYSFTPVTPIEILNPKDEYIIQLWDYDSLDPNDYIEGLRFTPYYDTNGFPSTYSVECNTCSTAYKFYFQYVF